MKGTKLKFSGNQENIRNSVFDFDHWKPGTVNADGFDHDAQGVETYKLSGIARPLMRHELRVVKGSEAPTLIRRRLTKKSVA